MPGNICGKYTYVSYVHVIIYDRIFQWRVIWLHAILCRMVTICCNIAYCVACIVAKNARYLLHK
jgi:hypothetical protein